MANLSDIRAEVAQGHHQDKVRRKYLSGLSRLVDNDIILYATRFTQPEANIPSSLMSINDQDVQHLMSVISSISDKNGKCSKKLDLILHSPGGSLSATEQIVTYLRNKYEYIRVIVPQNAMSAATMLACAADEILMGRHSALGPTDPQLVVGRHSIAAQSIINEFEQAKKEIKKDPSTLAIWSIRINNWPTGLLDHCQRVIKLSKENVAEWLIKYMKLTANDARRAANNLSNANKHKIHDRPINYDELKSLKLKVTKLEDDQKLQDAVLSVFHAATVTFECTSCYKIVENHLGEGVYEVVRSSS